MKKITPFIYLAFVYGIASTANGQFAAVYNFTTAITDIPTVTNVIFNPISATNTSVIQIGSSPNFIASSSSWVPSGSSADTTEYISISLAANSGYTLGLSSLTFRSSNSATGPMSFSVALFTGGTLTESSATYSSSSTTSTTSSMPVFTFDFNDIASIASTSMAQFRFYGWGGSSAAGVLKFDDITVNGSVSAVPEPSTYAFFAGVITLGIATFHRRARRVKSAIEGSTSA